MSGDPISVNGVGEIPISSHSIPLGWKNQHSFRFGTEYQLPEIWTLRAGYVLSTQSTPEDRASATGTTPGNEHSFIIGAGREIRPFSKVIQMDLAIEYITISGEGNNSKPGSLDGQYTSRGIGFFTAFSYRL